MEYLVFFGAFAAFCLMITIQEIISARRAKQKLAEKLLTTFGKEPMPLKSERWDYIQGYFKKHQGKFALDDITWNDLEMDKFFASINFTQSALGEEYLYSMLRNGNLQGDEAKEFHTMCQLFEENSEKRIALQMEYISIGHTGKFSIYDYLEHMDLLGNRSSALSIISDLCILGSLICMPFFFYPAIAVFVCLLVLNIILYFKEKNTLSLYISSFLFILRLIIHGKKIEKMSIDGMQGRIQMQELIQELQPMTRGMGVVAKMNSPITGSNPLDIVFDYLKMAFHVDLLLFNRMYKMLQDKKDSIDALIGVLGRIEAAIAVAAFRHRLMEEDGYCIPELEYSKSQGVTITGGYHPLISHPVKNDISLKTGALITGSNASGKSSFLKMVALNTVLAQSIYTVAASSYKGFPCSVFSSMSLRDDMESGDSYFLVEIKAIKRILDAGKGERAIMCFVDEVLRGTNTIERIAASTQILKALISENILPFAATHDIELTYLLEGLYENYHFEESIQGEDVVFTYALCPGRANSRNAILLLQSMGYDSDLTGKASKLVETFERTGKWVEEAVDAPISH